jgi:hypothetical protein
MREGVVLYILLCQELPPSSEEHLILFIDANENTADGPLNSALSALLGLLMREGVCSLHPSLPRTPTFQ